MYKRMTLMLILVGILFVGIFGFQFFKSWMMKKWMSSNTATTVTVTTTAVQNKPWQNIVKATGTLRSVQGVDVTTEYAGLVRSIEFTPGIEVEKGTLLVKLNDDTEQAHLNSLKASLELAKSTYVRNQELLKKHAISQQTVDIDEANLKSYTAQVEEQKALIAKKIILAPFSGKLGISYINPGQYLNPGDKIVSLQSLNPIFADFYIPQKFITQIKEDQSVSISVNAYPNKTFSGKITTINPIIDPATRNALVEATLYNTEQELIPGMFATIEVTTGAPKNRLTLPQTAISYNPYGDTVYVVQKTEAEDKTPFSVQMRFVTLGDTRGDQIAIESGLTQGEEVVTSGQLKLKNGSFITINNTIQPSDDPSPNPVDQ